MHAFEAGDRRRPFALNFCRGSAPWQRLVQSGFYEVALTPAFEASLCHATSQNPQDSRIDRGMIQDGKLRGFAMGQAIPVRTDYTAGEVRRFAQRAKDAAQARRLLAIAAVLDGASREEAATIGGMDRQTLRDWVIRFNEQGADGLISIPSPGVPPKLNSRHKAFLTRIVEEGPIPAIHGVVRWRACDLIMRLYEEFGLSVSDDTIYRALKKLGFSHMSARPKAYKQNAEAMDAFKKTSPSVWRKSARSLHPAHR